MSLKSCFDEIESLQFQTKLSVVGGLDILQLVLEQNSTIKDLIARLETDPRDRKRLFERIGQLLRKVDSETELSYDESIAAYLYCLKRHDLNLARMASHSIWKMGGLWWSAQIAHQIIEFTGQIEESLDFASDANNIQNFVWGAPAPELVVKGVSNTFIHEFAEQRAFLEPIELSFAS